MIVLIGISLVTVVGLFFLYRVIAGDQLSSSASSPQPSVEQPASRNPVAEFEEKPRRKKFSLPFGSWFVSKEEKVEPILSLKDYVEQKSKEETVEEYDLSAIYLKKEKEAAQSASVADKTLDVRERLTKLQADYDQMDRLLHERTVELSRMQKMLVESESRVRRDFDRVRESLETQLKEAHRQNLEKAHLIEALKKAIIYTDMESKNSDQPTQTSSSFEERVSRDFVNLPPDVLRNAESKLRKSEAEAYQMSSEKEILRRLMENKKNL